MYIAFYGYCCLCLQILHFHLVSGCYGCIGRERERERERERKKRKVLYFVRCGVWCAVMCIVVCTQMCDACEDAP